MTKFHEAVAFVRSLQDEEKINFLQQALSVVETPIDRLPYITHTEGICGGSACVRDTRIPVWSIVEAKKLGFSDDRLLTSYPNLSLSDIEQALMYYAHNLVEIERDIRGNEEA